MSVEHVLMLTAGVLALPFSIWLAVEFQERRKDRGYRVEPVYPEVAAEYAGVPIATSRYVQPGTALLVPPRNRYETAEEWAARGAKIYIGPARSEESKP